MKNPLYIETLIACDMDQLWEASQNPASHQQWDLRFSRINYLPKTSPEAPQEFEYSTQLGGIRINGWGKSVATKVQENGKRTSVLAFGSENRLSLIQEGSGYWKYIPSEEGVRFVTAYDYQIRWGKVGQWIDSLIFRPLIGWATAWSFDCLKIWLEKGIPPRISLLLQGMAWAINLVLGLVWLYQGLVPKLLFPAQGELALLAASGWFQGQENIALGCIGILEMAFGLFLFGGGKKWTHYLNISLLLGLGFLAFLLDTSLLIQAFNPLPITLTGTLLSLIAILIHPLLPQASHCLTQKP